MPSDPTDTEWDLLDALWRLQPTTARDVTTDLTERRGWTYSTVKTMLDRMKAKGLVRAERDGKVWRYSAVIERQDARKSAWRRFVDMAFGGEFGTALHFAAGRSDLTDQQRAELRQLLADGEE